jgi:hypothetical protein
VVRKSARKGFVDLVVDPAEGHLAVGDIPEVLATVGIRSLVVLKVHLAAGSARQMNGDYQRGSRSERWLIPEAHNSEVDHR